MGEIRRVSGPGADWELTSGKVPLEKTLAEDYGQFTEDHKKNQGGEREGDAEWAVLMSEYLHEQTGLTAGTIAHDDELATDLGHLGSGVSK